MISLEKEIWPYRTDNLRKRTSRALPPPDPLVLEIFSILLIHASTEASMNPLHQTQIGVANLQLSSESPMLALGYSEAALAVNDAGEIR